MVHKHASSISTNGHVSYSLGGLQDFRCQPLALGFRTNWDLVEVGPRDQGLTIKTRFI